MESGELDTKDCNKAEYMTMNINRYIRKVINKWYRCIRFNYTDFNWKKIIIGKGNENFIVYLTQDHPKYKYVIRPAKKYTTFQFIGLFEFGFKCRGYREDKMVALIPLPDNNEDLGIIGISAPTLVDHISHVGFNIPPCLQL